MNSILSISIFLVAHLVCAEETYKVNGKNITFFQESNLQITASQECKKNKDLDACTNFSFLKKVSVEKLGRTPAGNPNSGALICEDQLNGESVMGFDESQNQRSFCFLSKQNLYIDNGTLSYYGRKNDGFYDKPETFNPGR